IRTGTPAVSARGSRGCLCGPSTSGYAHARRTLARGPQAGHSPAQCPHVFGWKRKTCLVSPRDIELSLRSCATLQYIADYRRAAALRIASVRERRATDRRASARAPTSCAATAAQTVEG